MKLRDTRIGTQLLLGFIAIFVFVVGLGTLSYFQADQIQDSVYIMYHHPLQVRRALSNIKLDISQMQLLQHELLNASSEAIAQKNVEEISLKELDVQNQIVILKEAYLGSQSDVDTLQSKYQVWLVTFDQDTQLIQEGQIQAFLAHVDMGGSTHLNLSELYGAVKIIDDFALAKASSLYLASVQNKAELNTQLFIIVAFILLLTLTISYYLMRNIRKPIKSINEAVVNFHEGNMSSRITFDKRNEFGLISDSINKMAEKVQLSMTLDDKMAQLSKAMLSEEELSEFFRRTLTMLMEFTSSQIGVAYIYNEKTQNFDHLLSIGASKEIKPSFSAKEFEGELGLTLSGHKLALVKNIAESSRFVYKSSSGDILPNEIMTIPVTTNHDLVAIISLATLSHFDELAIAVVENVSTIMSTRIEGILAFEKVKVFKENLIATNQELLVSKQELFSQASELIQQNTELEMQKNQLNEANKLKTNFLSNMSHELRTPLNSVIALSGILNRQIKNKVSDEEYSYLEVIERNGRNLLALINDILDISRIEAGKEEIDLNSFDMNRLVDDMVELIKPQAIVKAIELTNESKGSEVRVRSDLRKCQHILQNLIGNAVKFTEKGYVSIFTKINGNNIEVTVKDTGIGISEANIGHIFDEFRQADGSTTRRFGGTGLGLTIAKKYAQILEGDVTVKSALNQGSEFTLTLPLNYNPESHMIDEVIHPITITDFSFSRKDMDQRSILLVDDNETALIQIRDLLSDTGIHIYSASNVTDAFQIIQKHSPDAIVLDLMMPDIDGFKMLELLRNDESTINMPVLILTAKHITKDDLKFLKRNNVHELVLKGSVERNSLQNAIGNMLQSTQKRKEPPLLRDSKLKPLILVVEDNPDNMITAKALLEGRFRVIEAVDGHEAITLARASLPDLILMDIALPKINGIEAFKQIRKLNGLSRTPIIALTASAMEHDRESILIHGFDAYIAKPIIAKEFYKTIEEVLYGR